MRHVDRARLPPVGPVPPFAFPAIEKRRLANGLSIWTVEHPRLPVVVLLLLVRAGSAADPDDRPGLAALAGDMLDEGAGDRSGLALHEALARIGALFETDVGADATLLSLTTLTRFLDDGLSLLADMAWRPRLDPVDLARVRDLRLNRVRQLRDVPQAVADQVLIERLYRGHPYGHVSIGTEASLAATTHDDVVAFHRQTFVPAAATLIAVGDLTHDACVAGADRVFGGWRAPGEAAGAGVDGALAGPPGRPGARVVLVPRPGAAQSEVRIGQVAVPRSTPDYHALLVLNMILGGQFVSRLNLSLRERRGITYGVRTMFDFRRGPGPFVFLAGVQADATGVAIREVMTELEDIRGARPASAEEVEDARAALTRGYPRSFETAGQIAYAAARLALYDLPEDYFTRFVPAVTAVDAEAVTQAAAARLDPDRLLTVVVGDSGLVAPQLETLGMDPPIEVSPP